MPNSGPYLSRGPQNKNKESKKKKKKKKREKKKKTHKNYLDLARELSELWIMCVGNRRTNLDHPKNIIVETCCHSRSSERLSANAGVKNPHGV